MQAYSVQRVIEYDKDSQWRRSLCTTMTAFIPFQKSVLRPVILHISSYANIWFHELDLVPEVRSVHLFSLKRSCERIIFSHTINESMLSVYTNTCVFQLVVELCQQALLDIESASEHTNNTDNNNLNCRILRGSAHPLLDSGVSICAASVACLPHTCLVIYFASNGDEGDYIKCLLSATRVALTAIYKSFTHIPSEFSTMYLPSQNPGKIPATSGLGKHKLKPSQHPCKLAVLSAGTSPKVTSNFNPSRNRNKSSSSEKAPANRTNYFNQLSS